MESLEHRLINIQSYKLGLMLELILEMIKHIDPEQADPYRKRLNAIISLTIKQQENEKNSD